MPYPVGTNSANYNLCADWDANNGNVTAVGTNGGPSYYGTYDQGGNVFEWNDLNNTSSALRGIRGGSWDFTLSQSLRSNFRLSGQADTESSNFGFRLASSGNPLNIPYFVTVGDTENISDTTTYGSVNYEYLIGQYPVTNCEYAVFLNAVAKTDSYGLYNVNMANNRCGIIRNGNNGSYTYIVNSNYTNKPVVYISWFDAARYCNWLHNNKPNGIQDDNTTEDGAYYLNKQITGNAPIKNINAKYYIPSENEWYKAAYYSTNKNGSVGYWTYPTQSDAVPSCVNANIRGNGPEISNYSCDISAPTATPSNTATPTKTPTNTPTNTITPTQTRTPKHTPLAVACRPNCCYYICIEEYNEYNNCSTNNIIINLESNFTQLINTDQYQLIVEGNCLDPLSNPINIVSNKNDCYGCSKTEPKNICNNNNSIIAQVLDTNIKCCIIPSGTTN